MPITLAASSLKVTAATTGFDLDRDGYRVTVDTGAPHPLSLDGSVMFQVVPAGVHDVRLDGVASNCSLGGGTRRSVSVTEGSPATVTFAVVCTTLGSVGGGGVLQVTTTTGGTNPDPDGYIVGVDRGASTTSTFVATNGTARIGVAAGSYTVSLLGVAGRRLQPRMAQVSRILMARRAASHRSR